MNAQIHYLFAFVNQYKEELHHLLQVVGWYILFNDYFYVEYAVMDHPEG